MKICFPCIRGEKHPYHDNGTINQSFDWAEFNKENAPPTSEGDGYEDKDQGR